MTIVAPCNWVTEALMAEITGYTIEAIRSKRKNGVWLEGKLWKKAPDGRVLYSPSGYEQWVEEAA